MSDIDLVKINNKKQAVKPISTSAHKSIKKQWSYEIKNFNASSRYQIDFK